MKSTDFIRILREVIKKEVRSVIREELQSALKPSSVTESHPRKTTTPQRSFKPVTSNTAIQNSPIRDILEETARSMRSSEASGIPEEDEWQDMGGMMTADQAQGFGHMAQHNNQTQQSTPSSTDAFIKDYSQVLQSSYEKTGR
jgi:hypothetical protein